MPTIDSDLQQVIEEMTHLVRRSAAAYPTPQQRLRLKFLTARRTLLARVLLQRMKEHEEVTE